MTIILLKIFLLLIFWLCAVKTHTYATKDYTEVGAEIYVWLFGVLISAIFVMIL